MYCVFGSILSFMAKDYYKILGVDKGASKDEIKKAFHKLAHKHHPDKGGDEKQFKEANEAYQVLSDEEKRRNYDTYGNPNGQQGFGGASGGMGGFDFSGFAQGMGGQGFEGVDLNDIFGDMFGGGRRTTRARRGRDISVDESLTFKEAVFGVERTITLNKATACDVCDGSGAKPGAKMNTCSECKGHGKITETRQSILGAFSQTRTCGKCGGAGKIPEEKCHTCKGDGIVRKKETFTVKIPAGIEPGEMVRLTGAGEAVQGGAPGDLYVRVHIGTHPHFKREGEHLIMNLKVKLSDALLGAEYPIETLDGDIKLKIPRGISSGEVLRVKEKGVPYAKGRRGDLFIKVEVKNPTKLSKKAEKLIEELREEGI